MSLRQEMHTLRAMIRLFCVPQHRTPPLCESCSELLEYAEQRLAKCPFGEKKPACQECHVHCYTPEMRSRITDVMRFAGPRMFFHQPIMTLRHWFHTTRSKRNQKNA
ncbi:MAG: nitrous oxide-stimulated promoter family protein [Planctomycetes bacterium]|nr:nitrous oxide-stimulated promoter family protein [Planctomycetota bacterium]